MGVLGVIPARGGSKSIPRKNLAIVAGRPLIDWTISAALAATSLDTVVVSTDDREIARFGRSAGALVPFLRPAELATDEAPMRGVLRHAIEWHQENGTEVDVVVVLQPTSPLRTASHIDEAVHLLRAREADSVVSVVPVPHRFSPYSVMRERDGLLERFWTEALDFDPHIRQQQPALWARNGPVVLVCRTAQVMTSDDLYGERIVPMIMSPEESVDVDDPFDLEVADWLLRRRDGIEGTSAQGGRVDD